jgi:hypothetical protein
MAIVGRQVQPMEDTRLFLEGLIMHTKVLSLLTGASLLAFVGAASAGEAVTLSDAQLDTVTAAGGVRYNSDIRFDKRIDVRQFVDVYGTIDPRSRVYGNIATGDATADASGPNSFTSTFTDAQAQYRWGSSSISQSVASTNGGPYRPCWTCY